MKKKFKLLVVVMILCLSVYLFFRYYYACEKLSQIQNEQKQQVLDQQMLLEENERRLQEELLKKNLENATNFVTSISKETKFVLLTLNGKYTLNHDKTPENNKLFEWAINSEIKMNVDYIAAFCIKTDDITIDIDDKGSVNVLFSTKSINLEFIDISNIVILQDKGIFGEDYTASQVLAFENIIKDKIYSDLFISKNIDICSQNFIVLIEKLAKSMNVEEISIININ